MLWINYNFSRWINTNNCTAASLMKIHGPHHLFWQIMHPSYSWPPRTLRWISNLICFPFRGSRHVYVLSFDMIDKLHNICYVIHIKITIIYMHFSICLWIWKWYNIIQNITLFRIRLSMIRNKWYSNVLTILSKNGEEGWRDFLYRGVSKWPVFV